MIRNKQCISFGSLLIACTALSLFCMAGTAPAHADGVRVMAVPDTVSFSRMEDAAEIRLMLGDRPLPSSALRSARIQIDDRDYTHQFRIERSTNGPAIITIRPNPQTAQVGEFTLRIDTSAGPARATVRTPLDALPDMIENQAKARGITVDQLRAEMGLSHPGPRQTLVVNLPDSFFEGYRFHLELPDDGNLAYVWRVNGNVVKQGQGERVFNYVFQKAGDYDLAVDLRKGDGTVASWKGKLHVTAAPAVAWNVPSRTEVRMPAPQGFHNYTWRVDGRDVGTGAELKYTFATPGQHHIECVAQQPSNGDTAEFRRFSWNTTVR